MSWPSGVTIKPQLTIDEYIGSEKYKIQMTGSWNKNPSGSTGDPDYKKDEYKFTFPNDEYIIIGDGYECHSLKIIAEWTRPYTGGNYWGQFLYAYKSKTVPSTGYDYCIASHRYFSASRVDDGTINNNGVFYFNGCLDTYNSLCAFLGNLFYYSGTLLPLYRPCTINGVDTDMYNGHRVRRVVCNGDEYFIKPKGFNVVLDSSIYTGDTAKYITLTAKLCNDAVFSKQVKSPYTQIESWGDTTIVGVREINVKNNDEAYMEFKKPDNTLISIYTGSGGVDSDTYTLGEDLIFTYGYYDSHCIDENTLITMADGTTKPMKEIEIGDEVLSIDWDTLTLIGRKVIYTGKDAEDYDQWVVHTYWQNTFSDGTIIKQAMAHRFYNLETKSFVYLDNWNVGDHTYNLSGNNPELVSRERIQGNLHYGQITLENSNNFFANGLLTGDRRCPSGYELTYPLPHGNTKN